MACSPRRSPLEASPPEAGPSSPSVVCIGTCSPSQEEDEGAPGEIAGHGDNDERESTRLGGANRLGGRAQHGLPKHAQVQMYGHSTSISVKLGTS